MRAISSSSDLTTHTRTQAIFAVVTVVPAPGVDVFRAFESVCRECTCATVRDERLMLLARMRMYATDVGAMKVAERNRRIPLDGVNAFVRAAQEHNTANKITSLLRKHHGTKMTDLKIIGLAVPEGPEQTKEFAKSAEVYIDRTVLNPKP
jgi:hypothetical protein